MKNSGKSKISNSGPGDHDGIGAYSAAQTPPFRQICNTLRDLIETALPGASSRVWHGSPVWFIDENPVVGYSATAKAVSLLFWNGRSFNEPGFKPVGKYQAAQVLFADTAEIDGKAIGRWLKSAQSDVLDSKAFFKKVREARARAADHRK